MNPIKNESELGHYIKRKIESDDFTSTFGTLVSVSSLLHGTETVMTILIGNTSS